MVMVASLATSQLAGCRSWWWLVVGSTTTSIEHGWPRHEYSKHSSPARHNLHATTPNQWRLGTGEGITELTSSYVGEPHETLSRDSTVVRNIKKIKIFSTRNSSLIGPVVWREDLFLASLIPFNPSARLPQMQMFCLILPGSRVENCYYYCKKFLTIIYKRLRDL